jgi:hypothetical protein
MGAQELTGSELLRRELTPAQRAAPMRLAIDPGFVNHRLIETVLGSRGTGAINQQIAYLPLDMPEWLRTTQLGHISTRTVVASCEINKMRL